MKLDETTLKKTLICTCGLMATNFAEAKITKSRPNIIIIYTDDLGYGDLSCQGFRDDIKTPNIDNILNNGIRFTNCYAGCPVSSPSRAALLTGRYPDMVGVPGVIRTVESDSWGYLSQEATLLPEMMKQQGYHSAIIGKWHLGLDTPNIPNEQGFDYFHGFLGDMMDDYYTHTRGGFHYMRENEVDVRPEGHATEIFTRWAQDYVSSQSKYAPFFLYLAYNAPHNPFQPPTEWLEKVKKREPNMSEKRAKVVALIEHLDYNIGELYKTLEKNGQLENTMIIFSSDNGGHVDSQATNGNLRGGKEDLYEGGIKIPTGVYWKGAIDPQINDNFVMQMDFFPTICDLIGVSVEHKIDGMSILPILNGEKQITDERTIFWMRREGNGRYGGNIYYAARYKNYKLMHNNPKEELQMFNLEVDPLEENNIIDKNDENYKKLFKSMMEHIRVSGSVPWSRVIK